MLVVSTMQTVVICLTAPLPLIIISLRLYLSPEFNNRERQIIEEKIMTENKTLCYWYILYQLQEPI